MQTGLQSFDLSMFGASGKSQKAVPGGAKPTKDAGSDQLAGFMEIMSALLALPPEQWKQSLAEFEAGSEGGGSADLPCLAGNSGQNMSPAELVQLIMNMKGAVLQQLQSAKADGKPHPILDMAEALMTDPRIAALGPQEAGEAQLTQDVDPGPPFSQAEPAVQDDLEIDLDGNGENRLFPGGNQETAKSKNPLAAEMALDSENQSPADAALASKPAAPGKNTSKTSRPSSQANDFLFQTSDASSKDPKKGGNLLTAEITKTPVADSLPDQESPAVDKGHQPLAAADVKNGGGDLQPHIDGENFAENSGQKHVLQSGGHHGLIGQQEAGQESKGLTVSGDMEAPPQEKAAPSDIIRQIVQRMSMQTNGAQSKMVIRLKPEFLGNVHLHVLTENHQVTVRMMADSTLVKEIVEQNLPHLQAELQHHGLEIQKFDVFVANDDQGWRGGQEQAGFRDTTNRRQSRSGGGKARHQRGKVTFDTGNEKKSVQKDPGEIDYFA
jgi:flagellar hook-length control protein FliK